MEVKEVEHITKLVRKVWYKDKKGTSPAIAIPRWWVGNDESMELDVYPDFIIVYPARKREKVNQLLKDIGVKR